MIELLAFYGEGSLPLASFLSAVTPQAHPCGYSINTPDTPAYLSSHMLLSSTAIALTSKSPSPLRVSFCWHPQSSFQITLTTPHNLAQSSDRRSLSLLTFTALPPPSPNKLAFCRSKKCYHRPFPRIYLSTPWPILNSQHRETSAPQLPLLSPLLHLDSLFSNLIFANR